jgi:hypothetical protein
VTSWTSGQGRLSAVGCRLSAVGCRLSAVVPVRLYRRFAPPTAGTWAARARKQARRFVGLTGQRTSRPGYVTLGMMEMTRAYHSHEQDHERDHEDERGAPTAATSVTASAAGKLRSSGVRPMGPASATRTVGPREDSTMPMPMRFNLFRASSATVFPPSLASRTSEALLSDLEVAVGLSSPPPPHLVTTSSPPRRHLATTSPPPRRDLATTSSPPGPSKGGHRTPTRVCVTLSPCAAANELGADFRKSVSRLREPRRLLLEQGAPRVDRVTRESPTDSSAAPLAESPDYYARLCQIMLITSSISDCWLLVCGNESPDKSILIPRSPPATFDELHFIDRALVYYFVTFLFLFTYLQSLPPLSEELFFSSYPPLIVKCFHFPTYIPKSSFLHAIMLLFSYYYPPLYCNLYKNASYCLSFQGSYNVLFIHNVRSF